jgi:hypothetical protein
MNPDISAIDVSGMANFFEKNAEVISEATYEVIY